jgi:hypothetical protein
MLLYC